MKKFKQFYLCVWIGIISCIMFSGCSSDTDIQVQKDTQQPIATENTAKTDETDKKQATENTAKTDETDKKQEGFMAFEERTLPVWNYDEGIYPTTFQVYFSKMSEEEIEDAWSEINASPLCQKTAIVQSSALELFLEANQENINPAFVEWCTDSSSDHWIPRVGEDPGKIDIQTVYTTTDADENVLFETPPIDGGEYFTGNFVVNFTDGADVTIAKPKLKDTENLKFKEFSITLDKVTTEADWMYDVSGYGLYLKLTNEDFEKLVSPKIRATFYYVKSVKGSEGELREYVKSLGGNVLEDIYFE